MIPRHKHWLYKRFRWMLAVTTVPTHPDYHWCGGRGIKCYWQKNQFDLFVEYIENNLGRCQYPEIFLHRIDQRGDYAPGNLCWASGKRLGNDQLDNVFITWQDQTQTLKQWSEHFNINYHTLRTRLHRGYTFEQSISKPIRKYHDRKKTLSR